MDVEWNYPCCRYFYVSRYLHAATNNLARTAYFEFFLWKNWKIPQFRGSTNPHYLAMIFHGKYLTWHCHIDETSSDVFYEKILFY